MGGGMENGESKVRLYALSPIELAEKAIKDLSVLEKRDQAGQGYIPLHWPAIMPVLGSELLLGVRVSSQVQDQVFSRYGDGACDVSHHHFRVPTQLLEDAELQILGYEDLVKLAGQALDRGMIPSSGCMQDKLEMRIANNQYLANDALLLAALERKRCC